MFGATAHIASTTGEVTPRFPDHIDGKANGVLLAIVGHYKALISRRNEEFKSVLMKKSTSRSCGD